TQANDRKPMGGRSELVGELESLGEWLRDLLALLTGAEKEVSDPDAMPILRRMAEQRRIMPEGVMKALGRVGAARELAYGNVNPQLIVARLLTEMQDDLRLGSGEGGR